MATLKHLLPEPVLSSVDRATSAPVSSCQTIALPCAAPPYGQRVGWVPRTEADYDDGGAYPECHVAQHPLGLGSSNKKDAAPGNTLAVTLDSEGRVKYDAIARQGHAKDKIVFSKFTDLLPEEVLDESTAVRPDDETVQAVTERTRLALEKLTSQKISAAMPVKAADKKAPAQYIRYTPSQQGLSFNSGAKQRVIRMVEVQKDPMEPPRFKINAKIPRGPPSPPAPVMHSPTRKMTVKEQQDWRIPPCISNWKNAKGYTVPLDKRMAADGRGLQQLHINENFAKLSESLYIADRKSREAVEMRAQLEKKLAHKEKERKEETLRDLAKKAREERAGIRTNTTAAASSAVPASSSKDGEEVGVEERDAVRQERHRERARERNLARTGQDRRSRQQRERERDISEQIALGVPRASSSADQFDQRLFDQSRGVGSGFGDDEAYNVYDRAWQAGSGSSVAQHIYRPGANVQREMYGDDLQDIMKNSRFAPDKGFEGADSSAGAASRAGPVQFERHHTSSQQQQQQQQQQPEFDPFGIDQFLTRAKQASKRPGDDSRDDRDKRRRH